MGQFVPNNSKTAAKSAVLVAVCSLQLPANLSAQAIATKPIDVADGVSVAGALLVWSIPNTFNWHIDTPSCAPCDPTGVPFFDRWAIHQPRPQFAIASDAAIFGLAALSWIDLGSMGPNGAAEIAGSVNAVAWTFALTSFAKGAFGRKRPVMYTDIAPEASNSVNSQRSMPSGHTSMAFALATSYWLSRRKLADGDKPWMRWALMAGATGIGVLRVAAGKHHPSDVLIGAGVGIGTAIISHEIRF
jgi:membrane-associated phospholipid phosphatase